MSQKKKESTLKDFTIDHELADKEEDLGGTMYREEINSLRIEKLGNRVTIISVILPCLIGAVLFFSYMDIKERMVSAQDTEQSKVETITTELEDKINAMNVDLAETQHLIKTRLPDIEKRINGIEADSAALFSKKADAKKVDKTLETLVQQVDNNTKQYKTALNLLDRTNNETIGIIKDTTKRLKKEIKAVKELVSTRTEKIETSLLAKIKNSVQKDIDQISILENDLEKYRKETARTLKEISLVGKKLNTLETTRVDKAYIDKEIKEIQSRLNAGLKKLSSEISAFQKNSNGIQDPDTTDKIKETPLLKDTQPGEIFEKDLKQ
ncbi:MAG: hypothetical protein R6U68_08195 [Desulfobacteraceae bacterium]